MIKVKYQLINTSIPIFCLCDIVFEKLQSPWIDMGVPFPKCIWNSIYPLHFLIFFIKNLQKRLPWHYVYFWPEIVAHYILYHAYVTVHEFNWHGCKVLIILYQWRQNLSLVRKKFERKFYDNVSSDYFQNSLSVNLK